MGDKVVVALPGESTSLLMASPSFDGSPKQKRWYLFGIHSRKTWMWIQVVVLFIGRAVMPLSSESLDASSAALIEDPSLNISTADVAALSSTGALCGAAGKLFAGPLIALINPRNAWILLLAVGATVTGLIAHVSSLSELYVLWAIIAPCMALGFPALTAIVASWVDGNLLGRVLGLLTFAAKGAPSLVDAMAIAVMQEGTAAEAMTYNSITRSHDPQLSDATRADSAQQAQAAQMDQRLLGGWANASTPTRLGQRLPEEAALAENDLSRYVPLWMQRLSASVVQTTNVEPEDPTAWRKMFVIASVAFGVTLVIFVVLARSSAEAVGFRRPSAPDKPQEAGRKSSPDESMRRRRSINAGHRFEATTTWDVLLELRCTRRFWTLLVGYTFLFSSRSVTKYLTVFARAELHTSYSTADMILLLSSLPTMAALLVGGTAYDFLPSKAAVAIFFSVLLSGVFVSMLVMLFLYASGGLDLPALAMIVFVHGLCLPLPLYLPFAVFAMAFGGPRHCASIICIFELVGLCSSSAFQICVGLMLDGEDYVGWFVLQFVVSTIGCVATAIYFFLDWQRSPNAGTLTSAPSVHTGLGNAPAPSPSSCSPPRSTTSSTRGGMSGIYRGPGLVARSRSQERLASVPGSPPSSVPGSPASASPIGNRLSPPVPPDIPPVAAASPLIAPSRLPPPGGGNLASVDE